MSAVADLSASAVPNEELIERVDPLRRRRRLRVIAYGGAIAPVLHALVRALSSDWMAASDNAMIAVRALDVLSGNSPLAGTSSSVSAGTEVELRHPGPLLFDILVIPVRLLGADLALPLTMALLNGAFAVWTIWLAGRCAGLRAQLVFAVAVNALAWSMGWYRLVEPYNPHATMIPCLLFLVACWAIAIGERRGLLAAVVAGSFCLQVHVGYVYIVPFALVVAALTRFVQVRLGAAPRARPVRRDLTLLAGVAVVLWIQPIADVLANGGDSNPGRLLSARNEASDTLAVALGTRIVGAVVAVPPIWARSGFSTLGVADPPPRLLFAALGLLVVVALLVGIAWTSRARVALSSAAAFSAGLVVVSVVAISLIPVHDLFVFAPHEFRWLWAVGVIVAATAAWGVSERVASSTIGRMLRGRHELVAVAAVVVAVAMNFTNLGARTEPGLQPRDPVALRAVLDELPYDRLRGCDGVVAATTMAFPALEYAAVLLALRERDVAFTVLEPQHQSEFDRRVTGDEQCVLTIADPAPTALPGQIAAGGHVQLGLTVDAVSGAG